MIGEEQTIAWLEHRTGLHKLAHHPKPYFTKALELNDKGEAFVSAYGRREIRGFVGFVDLVGFSTKVTGKSPSEISGFLRPFISGVIDETFSYGALVDKTIGDEVMCVLPDTEEDGGAPAVLLMGQLLGGLHDLQRKLGTNYPFRIGLSYGFQFVDLIEGNGYKEWTIVGESVNLAKRLQSLPGAEPKEGIGGAFGVLVKEIDERKFKALLGIIAGFASRMTHQVIESTVTLKGVSSSRCALLLPQAPSNDGSQERT